MKSWLFRGFIPILSSPSVPSRYINMLISLAKFNRLIRLAIEFNDRLVIDIKSLPSSMFTTMFTIDIYNYHSISCRKHLDNDVTKGEEYEL